MTRLSSMLYCRIGLHRWISHRKPENGVPYRQPETAGQRLRPGFGTREGCRQRDGPRVAAGERSGDHHDDEAEGPIAHPATADVDDGPAPTRRSAHSA